MNLPINTIDNSKQVRYYNDILLAWNLCKQIDIYSHYKKMLALILSKQCEIIVK
jgi:hypothetical protein